MKNNNLLKMNLTEKEEKAIATVVSFLQGLKDCKKEDEEKYIIDNAYACRMIMSFGARPNESYTVLASNIINAIIPYFIADKTSSIDKIAENIDKETEKIFKENMISIVNKSDSNEKNESFDSEQ